MNGFANEVGKRDAKIIGAMVGFSFGLGLCFAGLILWILT